MINIKNQNCMELLKSASDNQYDLAIVDPPYGIGDTWSKSRKDRFYKDGKNYQYQNKEIPSKEYFEELFRVSKNQIIWGGNYFTEYLPPTNAWIIWDKKRDAKKTYMSEGELAWTSFSKVVRITKFLWDGARKCEKVDKIHPHQKPVMLYKWVLEEYGSPGDSILDTHVGSNSIGIACYDLGFDLEGSELDPEYYQRAIDRLEKHKRILTFDFK